MRSVMSWLAFKYEDFSISATIPDEPGDFPNFMLWIDKFTISVVIHGSGPRVGSTKDIRVSPKGNSTFIRRW